MFGFLYPAVAIISGALAASSFITRKFPETESFITKIRPYEAIIGATALFFSISGFFNIDALFKHGKMLFLLNMSSLVACFIVGFLLGFPVLQGLFIDDLKEENRDRAQEFYYRLTPYKTTAGIVCIGCGCIMLLL